MAKKRTDNPGDHLLDCLRDPKRALERAARREIPLVETLSVAFLGMLGLGWSVSGVVFAEMMAFERFIFGSFVGVGVIAPLALYLGAVNALQPPGPRDAATLRRSLGIVATSLVLPAIVTLATGFGGLALTSFVSASWAAAAPALLGPVVWLLSLVLQTGIGHALCRRGSQVAGIGTSLAALLVTSVGTALTVWILLNPPWAKEELWQFL